MINRNQIFLLSKDVLSQEIDGEAVLLDMKSECYFGLNEVGSKILATLQKGATLDYLVSSLQGDYEVDKDTLEADISVLLSELLEAGLIFPESN